MNEHVDQSQAPFDLDTCDLEPIHTPGRIQPFGVMLAGPAALQDVWYCSANTEEVFGSGADAVLDSNFTELLGGEVVHDLRNLLSGSTARSQRERLGRRTVNGVDVEIYAHLNPERIAVVELEPVTDSVTEQGQTAIDQMRKILAKAGGAETLDGMLSTAVAGLRALVGYDRVMAYRYAENGDGEVVAEAKDPELEPLLGLRYPAWDVPQQARALQVKNPLRMLVDVHQTPIPIYADARSRPPLDMALAHLRGVSPIHVEYLHNMGVGASLTVGLVVEGRLWGMFSCHHRSPRMIGSDMRIAVELFGQMMSLMIKQRQDLEATLMRKRALEARERLLAETDVQHDLLNGFPDFAEIMLQVIDADGFALLREDKVMTIGNTPDGDGIRQLADYLPDDDDLVAATHALAKDGWMKGCDLRQTAGALLIRSTATYPLQLAYFRDEITRKVKWAGEPKKEMEQGPDGPRISPRQSFAAFMENQRGTSNVWTAADMIGARELQIMMTQIAARGERLEMIRHRELVSHQRQQDLMIAELNHRVKNILTLIRSLSRQAKASSASLESYAESLEMRISALASAHDLAVSNAMGGVSLRSILETELSPYLSDSNMQVLMSGPLIGLRADVAPIIALVLHEVVSNAVKYGALSTEKGVVKASWVIADGQLKFAWREIGGPPVSPPEQRGFGRTLIEQAITYELDGETALSFEESGVVFDFQMPESALVPLSAETRTKVIGQIANIEKVASGTTALLVEDNMVLAMDMLETLSRLGTENVETAATVEKGLSLIGKNRYDYAVLDMNLRGVVSFDLAKALKQRKTPFIFVTGYGSSITLPPDMQNVPVLTKPIDDGTLSKVIEKLLGRD